MRLVLLSMLIYVLGSCAHPNPNVPGGVIYSGVKGPITATSLASSGKTGEACASNILGIVAIGDNSIDAAKNNGGIKKVASVDYNWFSVLGVYAKVCTIVKGAAGGKGAPAE